MHRIFLYLLLIIMMSGCTIIPRNIQQSLTLKQIQEKRDAVTNHQNAIRPLFLDRFSANPEKQIFASPVKQNKMNTSKTTQNNTHEKVNRMQPPLNVYCKLMDYVKAKKEETCDKHQEIIDTVIYNFCPKNPFLQRVSTEEFQYNMFSWSSEGDLPDFAFFKKSIPDEYLIFSKEIFLRLNIHDSEDLRKHVNDSSEDLEEEFENTLLSMMLDFVF